MFGGVQGSLDWWVNYDGADRGGEVGGSLGWEPGVEGEPGAGAGDSRVGTRW